MIYNDPVAAAGPYTSFPKADLILVSHTHTDHFSTSTINDVRGSNVVIIAPRAATNGMSSTLLSQTITLTNGQSIDVLGLHIDAVPAYNGFHPQGTGNGYVVTIGGKRFYMSGDTGDIPEMRGLSNIDVAFVCMNVPFTMPVTSAVSVVRAFAPGVIYPYHYRNQDGTLANLSDFKLRVGQDLGIEVRLRKWY
jgi:L-ascorbate metabolism protein UlaG (beta-lactamase superfamily)